MNRVLLLMLATVMIFASGFDAQGQTRVLNGKVSDNAGNPIPGVNILDRVANSGNTTNIDGEYSISVSDQSVLFFSFIGVASQSITGGNQSELTVVLLEDAKSLSELVVTASGTNAEKEKLVYSVTTVNEEVFYVERVANGISVIWD